MKKLMIRTLSFLLWATLLGAGAFPKQALGPKPLTGAGLKPQGDRRTV